MVKVSVILPSLNVAGYIRETIESVIHQSLTGLEIICVDAGSADGTREILEEYEREPGLPATLSFRLIDSEVKSYGHQVNLGIEAASGQYIAIVETDDFIAGDMFEKLYALGEATGADIVKSTYYDYFSLAQGSFKTGNIIRSGVCSVSKLAAITAPKGTFTADACPELLMHHPSIWSALYRRAFLEEKQLRFPEIPGAGWADNPFMLESFIKADKIVYTPEAFYYYRKDTPGSSTALKNCRLPFERIADMRQLLETWAAATGSVRKKRIYEETINHRALRYGADALASPDFSQDADFDFIRAGLMPIPASYISDPHVTSDERKAYNYFTGRVIGESPAHIFKSLFYKLRMGFGYIKNKKLSK